MSHQCYDSNGFVSMGSDINTDVGIDIGIGIGIGIGTGSDNAVYIDRGCKLHVDICISYDERFVSVLIIL